MSMNVESADPAVTQNAPGAGTFAASARKVIDIEARAIASLGPRIDAAFEDACRRILACSGRVVASGMGKSGHIARKVAATLASTGTPAFFVHPGEASHGDLGMIQPQDILLALSHSGETDELLLVLPRIKRQGNRVIAMTGNARSSLGRQADVNLDVSVPAEACPLGLSPTASTTAALVMGDALAIALLEARGFTSDDFARSHPAGNLGRQLLLHIRDVMHTGEGIPRVRDTASMSDALMEVTRKRLGLTAILDADDRLVGVFTDGDLRRAIDDQDVDLRASLVRELMSRRPKVVSADQLASEAAQMMEKHQVHALLVVDDDQHVVGALNIHDLLRARVV